MCLWLASWTNQARRQRSAVVEIQRVGGTVYYGDSVFESLPVVGELLLPVEEVEFPSESRIVSEAPTVIASLESLPHLERILMFPPQDEMIPELQRALPNVECEVITGAYLFWSDRYSEPNDG